MMAQCGDDGGAAAGYYMACYENSGGAHVGAFGLAYQDSSSTTLLASATTDDTINNFLIANGFGGSGTGISSTYTDTYYFPDNSYDTVGGGLVADSVSGCNSGSD